MCDIIGVKLFGQQISIARLSGRNSDIFGSVNCRKNTIAGTCEFQEPKIYLILLMSYVPFWAASKELHLHIKCTFVAILFSGYRGILPGERKCKKWNLARQYRNAIRVTLGSLNSQVTALQYFNPIHPNQKYPSYSPSNSKPILICRFNILCRFISM